jgi:prepilin-type N-terminal cleavage/methylation domain-containing protein
MTGLFAAAHRGFSLLELSIVLAVSGALVASLVPAVATQIESRQRRETVARLDLALEALYGHAMTFGRLPCPDAFGSGDGREDRDATEACTSTEGFLPHVDLAVPGRDAWSRRLRYRVSSGDGADFAIADDGLCRADDRDLDLCERGALEVYTRGDNPATSAVEAKYWRKLADQVPALIFSPGTGRAPSDNDAAWEQLASGDESENLDGDVRFVARDFAAAQSCQDNSDETVALCAFDDLLRWISPNVLMHRLVLAGRLP